MTDNDNVKILSFVMLGIKLWLEEDGDLHKSFTFNIHSYSLIQKSPNLCKALSSFGHNFTCNMAKLEMLTHS